MLKKLRSIARQFKHRGTQRISYLDSYPVSEKIQVFVRHCYYSSASAHKNRPPHFSHQKCHENLMATADRSKVELSFLLDTHYVKDQDHFVKHQSEFPVIEIDAGSETKAFLALLDHVIAQPFSDDTIIYFLEDDYLHREGWADILIEGISIKDADYVTLYDHADKYSYKQYQNLKSRLYHTESCHFRTTPSTTNTYAMRFRTLKKDFAIHRKFSLHGTITPDHQKFLKLGKMGRTLISPIPGWSTHCEPEFSSPCYAWDALI